MDAILFDFDLTLADSTTAITNCTNHALEVLGHEPVEPERVHRVIGLPREEMFRVLTGVEDPALKELFANQYSAHADVIMAEQTLLYDCVVPTLAALRQRGVKTAIISMKFRHRIEAILRRVHLMDAVDLILGWEDVTRQKPDPEGLLLGLERLGVSASRALYVGDHPFDAEAARRAGVHFVGVRTGATDEATWSSCTRLGIVDDVSGVIEFLR
jgi:phosphoglycolate phosphatase